MRALKDVNRHCCISVTACCASLLLRIPITYAEQPCTLDSWDWHRYKDTAAIIMVFNVVSIGEDKCFRHRCFVTLAYTITYNDGDKESFEEQRESRFAIFPQPGKYRDNYVYAKEVGPFHLKHAFRNPEIELVTYETETCEIRG